MNSYLKKYSYPYLPWIGKTLLLLVLTFFSFIVEPTNVFAAPLVRLEDESFTITLNRPSNGVYKLELSSTKLDVLEKPNLFIINNPKRLVIDIPGIRAQRGQESTISADPLLMGIRLGVHPEKLRLVIDVQGESDPVSFYSEEHKGSAFIFISFDSRVVKATRPTEEIEKKPIKESEEGKISELFEREPDETAAAETSVPKIGKTPERAPIITKLDDLQPKPSSNAAVIKEPKNVAPAEPEKIEREKEESKQTPTTPGETVVFSMDFKKTEDSGAPALLLTVDNLSEYTFKKKGDKGEIYILTIEKARLAGDHLSYPQWPPDSFSGFEGVVARQSGKDVLIKIYVSEGTNLSPFRTDGMLWVRVGK